MREYFNEGFSDRLEYFALYSQLKQFQLTTCLLFLKNSVDEIK